MKKICSILLILGLVAGLAACGSGNGQESTKTQNTASSEAGNKAAETETEKQLFIAQSVIDLSNVYFVNFSNAVKKVCNEKGFQYTLSDSKSDPALQVSAIENFIVQGVDVLIITPVDGEALGSVLQQAKDSGMVIIAADQTVPVRDAFVCVSEYEYGYAAGKIAADWINTNLDVEAKVGILNRPISETLINRSNGFKDGVTENSNAVIVAEQTANTAELGLKAVESILQSNPDINGFVCQNDTAALGAYEALTAAGKDPGTTFVVGVDGLQEAFEKIKEGGIFIGTVDNNPEGKGELVIEMALEVLANGPIEESVIVQTIPVTKDNVDQYIED